MTPIEYLILAPYFLLSALSAYSGQISRTNEMTRPLIFNSLAAGFALNLHWFILMLASVIIFFKYGFVFLIILYVLTLVVSPFTIKVGASLFLGLSAVPADDAAQRGASAPLLWVMTLWIPILFLAWTVSLPFILP